MTINIRNIRTEISIENFNVDTNAGFSTVCPNHISNESETWKSESKYGKISIQDFEYKNDAGKEIRIYVEDLTAYIGVTNGWYTPNDEQLVYICSLGSGKAKQKVSTEEWNKLKQKIDSFVEQFRKGQFNMATMVYAISYEIFDLAERMLKAAETDLAKCGIDTSVLKK